MAGGEQETVQLSGTGCLPFSCPLYSFRDPPSQVDAFRSAGSYVLGLSRVGPNTRGVRETNREYVNTSLCIHPNQISSPGGEGDRFLLVNSHAPRGQCLLNVFCADFSPRGSRGHVARDVGVAGRVHGLSAPLMPSLRLVSTIEPPFVDRHFLETVADTSNSSMTSVLLHARTTNEVFSFLMDASRLMEMGRDMDGRDEEDGQERVQKGEAVSRHESREECDAWDSFFSLSSPSTGEVGRPSEREFVDTAECVSLVFGRAASSLIEGCSVSSFVPQCGGGGVGMDAEEMWEGGGGERGGGIVKSFDAGASVSVSAREGKGAMRRKRQASSASMTGFSGMCTCAFEFGLLCLCGAGGQVEIVDVGSSTVRMRRHLGPLMEAESFDVKFSSHADGGRRMNAVAWGSSPFELFAAGPFLIRVDTRAPGASRLPLGAETLFRRLTPQAIQGGARGMSKCLASESVTEYQPDKHTGQADDFTALAVHPTRRYLVALFSAFSNSVAVLDTRSSSRPIYEAFVPDEKAQGGRVRSLQWCQNVFSKWGKGDAGEERSMLCAFCPSSQYVPLISMKFRDTVPVGVNGEEGGDSAEADGGRESGGRGGELDECVGTGGLLADFFAVRRREETDQEGIAGRADGSRASSSKSSSDENTAKKKKKRERSWENLWPSSVHPMIREGRFVTPPSLCFSDTPTIEQRSTGRGGGSTESSFPSSSFVWEIPSSSPYVFCHPDGPLSLCEDPQVCAVPCGPSWEMGQSGAGEVFCGSTGAVVVPLPFVCNGVKGQKQGGMLVVSTSVLGDVRGNLFVFAPSPPHPKKAQPDRSSSRRSAQRGEEDRAQSPSKTVVSLSLSPSGDLHLSPSVLKEGPRSPTLLSFILAAIRPSPSLNPIFPKGLMGMAAQVQSQICIGGVKRFLGLGGRDGIEGPDADTDGFASGSSSLETLKEGKGPLGLSAGSTRFLWLSSQMPKHTDFRCLLLHLLTPLGVSGPASPHSHVVGLLSTSAEKTLSGLVPSSAGGGKRKVTKLEKEKKKEMKRVKKQSRKSASLLHELLLAYGEEVEEKDEGEGGRGHRASTRRVHEKVTGGKLVPFFCHTGALDAPLPDLKTKEGFLQSHTFPRKKGDRREESDSESGNEENRGSGREGSGESLSSPDTLLSCHEDAARFFSGLSSIQGLSSRTVGACQCSSFSLETPDSLQSSSSSVASPSYPSASSSSRAQGVLRDSKKGKERALKDETCFESLEVFFSCLSQSQSMQSRSSPALPLHGGMGQRGEGGGGGVEKDSSFSADILSKLVSIVERKKEKREKEPEKEREGRSEEDRAGGEAEVSSDLPRSLALSVLRALLLSASTYPTLPVPSLPSDTPQTNNKEHTKKQMPVQEGGCSLEPRLCVSRFLVAFYPVDLSREGFISRYNLKGVGQSSYDSTAVDLQGLTEPSEFALKPPEGTRVMSLGGNLKRSIQNARARLRSRPLPKKGKLGAGAGAGGSLEGAAGETSGVSSDSESERRKRRRRAAKRKRGWREYSGGIEVSSEMVDALAACWTPLAFSWMSTVGVESGRVITDSDFGVTGGKRKSAEGVGVFRRSSVFSALHTKAPCMAESSTREGIEEKIKKEGWKDDGQVEKRVREVLADEFVPEERPTAAFDNLCFAQRISISKAEERQKEERVRTDVLNRLYAAMGSKT
uniref:Uncharacterized protein n=1 Tax=Chromera velia CCMP2878 TaxID=1169474 RepID=A0A0G4HA27_9ALVE|eukprot:Cvel_25556.t1-p1 / transcript=Cvel_25556.t1 / gene=Cvel_25556 / organism=Chromera_velia_CCMP2878 / gene_product=hypothetical protein / transcript_product=hypothetical protein / location=Cvel_scaffold2911:10137-17566(+) / protein_length=1668 / sequence_SO=supercontig / SO=protein_coding / is_pseudo=false